jgi:alpha-beta hydrolase superfamily lysophospholipase
MLLIHGIGGCKEHFLNLAGKLENQGITSIVFDGRAHGESDGTFCTYGYYEKQDISKIVDFIKKQNPEIRIGIWGNSLGGAIAIQAMENEKRIEFGVIESTFTALDQIVYDYQKRICKGIGLRLVTDAALEEAGKIANFNPDAVKPIHAVKNIHQPIFIAHGDNDENIHYTYGEQLYKNVASTQKEFVLIKGGGHFNLFAQGGKDYEGKLMGFIHRQFDKE